MEIERRFRRDGEAEYPELGNEDFEFEMELAMITHDVDRADAAFLNGQRYVRPADIARWHRWPEAEILIAAYGHRNESDKYGNRSR